MISISQGDTALLNLRAKAGQFNYVDLTGASFQTIIKAPEGAVVVFGNDQHTANPDQVNSKGKFTLSLSVDDTNSLAEGLNKEIVTQITIGPSIISYHGFGILNVLSAEPIT